MGRGSKLRMPLRDKGFMQTVLKNCAWERDWPAGCLGKYGAQEAVRRSLLHCNFLMRVFYVGHRWIGPVRSEEGMVDDAETFFFWNRPAF